MYLNLVLDFKYYNELLGLTLTWDVFKWAKPNEYYMWGIWLTLTWDVFKWG